MIRNLIDIIMRSAAAAELAGQLSRAERGRMVRVTGVAGSLDALLIAGLLRETRRQALIVCPDQERAERIADDLALCVESVAFYGAKGRREQTGSEDARTLRALATGETVAVVAAAHSLEEPLPAPLDIATRTFRLQRGEPYSFKSLLTRLLDTGFLQRDLVDVTGEFAVRGGILDIFPYGVENPVRLEFFGDTIESMREFDPVSQRSIRPLELVMITPDLTAPPAGALPGKSALADYFSQEALLVVVDPAAARSALETSSGKGTLQVPLEAITGRFSGLSIEPIGRPVGAIDIGAKPQPAINGSVRILRSTLAEQQREGIALTLMADGHAELSRLKDLLLTETRAFPGGPEPGDQHEENLLRMEEIDFLPATLHEGFIVSDLRHAVYTEHQIFNRLKRRGRRRPSKFRGLTEKEFHLLRKGDFVVHEDYGIGRFDGLKRIRVRGAEQEVVALSYDGGDRLYVNLGYVNKLQKYSSREGHIPALTKLGSQEWERLKARAKRKVKDIARDLIRLYAQRKSSNGFAYQPDTPWQKELEASFIYEDTFDQAKATREVKDDMEAGWPMDRLVCGDVGFGKTEVAVRAAFKAVLSGKQVAVLVPTTILAVQHYNTFTDRLSRYALRIDVLSRFKSKRQQSDILEMLATGATDIVIGTHRLLSKDVRFKNFGLLIVDEEHRFGVSAKEKLRQARVNVDTLALTATPIPRTLHFSLLGARDLSLIGTPPRNRRPVITEIIEWNDAVIREAVTREVDRRGQVFFVHDRIHNMEEIVQRLRNILGSVRIRYAHGQMPAHELEEVMLEFLEKQFDVLVSTKIIESGLDMPNVNTMIVNRADRFGMAELYQLRGRVGRSNVQAFAYLVTPPLSSLPASTIRRLQAVEEFTELGSGFNLAMRDLEIRGMGNLLGSEQSGFIENMGFETYTKILEEAVRELKEEDFRTLFGKEVEGKFRPVETVVEPDFAALIPEEYVGNDTERLAIYRRLYKLTSEEQLAEVEEELRDRFGRIPAETESLLALVRLKLFGTGNRMQKIRIGLVQTEVDLPPKSDSAFYDGESFKTLMRMISESRSRGVRLKQEENTLTLVIELPPVQEGRQAVEETLARLRKLLSVQDS